MSGKRFDPMEDPPTASSSSEEEEEVDSSSDEEEEDLPPSTKKSQPVEKEQVSDSESGSEEESESESEPVVAKKPEPPVKTKDPVVVKKKQDSKKVKSSEKPVTKTSEKPSKKRSSETDDTKDAKKVKKVSGEEENKKSEETKKYFQRLWSEEDEVSVLQGFIDYITEKKVSPFDDSNAFYQSVKESISFDVSKIQFMEKVRNLKKKFQNNLGKGKNGEEPVFAKAHDRKAFDLSKLIWGDNGLAPETTVKSNVKSKNSGKKVSKQELVSSLLNGKNSEEEGKGEEVGSSSFLVKSLARFGVDDLAAKQGWSRLSSEDKKRFEEQWNSLQQKEFELYSKKSGFVQEVVTKIAEAFQSNP